MLGNMAVVAPDGIRASLLICTHYLAQLFGVELLRERGGAYQITKHHRQLPPFGGRV
jgi:hypothetical protein